MHEFVFTDHHYARARHADRQARGLAAFAAGRRARVSREHCPLTLLAAWIASRRRRAAARGPVAFQGR